MRGSDRRAGALFSYVDLEARVRADHPPRSIRRLVGVRYGTRDGSACTEFSWEGNNDNDPGNGRGWATFGTAARLVGHIFIHGSDDSGFVAERE